MSCEVVGQVLLEAMKTRPDRRMMVLCGHTHGAAHYRALGNLEVRAGAATYRDPQVQGLIDLHQDPMVVTPA